MGIGLWLVLLVKVAQNVAGVVPKGYFEGNLDYISVDVGLGVG